MLGRAFLPDFDMPHRGTEVFSTTTPLPFAGSVGYTVRVLPSHPMLTTSTDLGLVTLA